MYIHKFKRIPSNLPRELTVDTNSYPDVLVPREQECAYCVVLLSEPKLITRKGVIITHTKQNYQR